MKPDVRAFFDKDSNSFSYVVSDPETKKCAILDSVLNYDPKAGRISTENADEIIDYVTMHKLDVVWLLETHAHADHLTAASYLKDKLGGTLAIGEHIVQVQEFFSGVFNTEPEFKTDGSQFDHLFGDGEVFELGTLKGRVMYTPGHTSACITYIIGDAAFVGDTLFMPDYGTARADFPGGDASQLYHSIRKLFELPDETRVFLCHDYGAPGRPDFFWETTIGEQREKNIHVRQGIGEEDFVKMRTERDATLQMPVLILPSVQVNIRAGNLPPPEDNGIAYLKIPVNAL